MFTTEETRAIFGAREVIYSLVGYFPGLGHLETARMGIMQGGRAKNAGERIINIVTASEGRKGNRYHAKV